jgi:hypothetical protein
VAPPPEKKPADGKADPPELDRVTVLDRFRIGVPEGWLRGTLAGAVVLHSPEGARVRVFLEPGTGGLGILSRQAARFLASEHPSAKVGDRERVRLGDQRALRLRARWGDGREDAIVLSASGYTYLILARVDESAPNRVEDQAEASLSSFRPL